MFRTVVDVRGVGQGNPSRVRHVDVNRDGHCGRSGKGPGCKVVTRGRVRVRVDLVDQGPTSGRKRKGSGGTTVLQS